MVQVSLIVSFQFRLVALNHGESSVMTLSTLGTVCWLSVSPTPTWCPWAISRAPSSCSIYLMQVTQLLPYPKDHWPHPLCMHTSMLVSPMPVRAIKVPNQTDSPMYSVNHFTVQCVMRVRECSVLSTRIIPIPLPGWHSPAYLILFCCFVGSLKGIFQWKAHKGKVFSLHLVTLNDAILLLSCGPDGNMVRWLHVHVHVLYSWIFFVGRNCLPFCHLLSLAKVYIVPVNFT